MKYRSWWKLRGWKISPKTMTNYVTVSHYLCVCVCVWNIRVNVVTLLMTLSLLCFDFKTYLHVFVCKYFNGDALFLLKELLVMGES